MEQDRWAKQQNKARLLAAGPDGVPAKGLKSCADQLSRVVNSIFNLRLSQALAPSCLKRTIIPVPAISSPKDYGLKGLTSHPITGFITNSFERLVQHMNACLPFQH